MQRIIFKNIRRLGPARKAVKQLMRGVTDRFPSLKDSRVYVALEMHNSSVPIRPDLFTVKVYVSDGKYRGVRLEKSGQNLYVALEEVVEQAIEKFSRLDDRRRIRRRDWARELIAIAENQGIRRKLFW